jgi:DNA processing protein
MNQTDYLQIAFQLLSSENLKLRTQYLNSGLTIEEFYNLSIPHFLKIGGTPHHISIFLDPIKASLNEIELAKENDISIVTKAEKNYPDFLRYIYDPPFFLYVKGNENLINQALLGVVGSRHHSQYGLRVLNLFLPPIISHNIGILSGMAYGIDTQAHLLAIQNNGRTVGVNAGGLLHLYPKGNRTLFNKIINSGCIISEFPLRTIPRPFHFPIRNRIIAGICTKLWVVEAAEKSGSLITARIANESGKDILATPGPVDSITSQGTNKLIQDGASTILSANDLLLEFNINPNKIKIKQTYLNLEDEEKLLLDLFKANDVKDIDFIIYKTKLPTSRVLSSLNGLLLKGMITSLPGGFWTKR